MIDTNPIKERIDFLISVYGSMREVAREFDIDCGYLSRLHSGEKFNPSDDVLEKLDLERVVTFKKIDRVYEATPLNPRTKCA